MAIELIIFDCDGVLVDSETITTTAWSEALREVGLDWDAPELLERFRGGTMAGVVAAAEAALGTRLPEGFRARFRTRLFERLRAEVRAVPGIHEALAALEQARCVASNGPHAKMEATLGSTGLWAHFEGRIFSAYDIGVFKPDPGLFLHAARVCGTRPERCVVVEDSDSGVCAGVAAGMRVLAFDAHHDGLRAEGATRFHDMARLPQLVAALD